MFKSFIFICTIFTFYLSATFTLELINNNAYAQVNLSPEGVGPGINTPTYRSKQASQYKKSEEYGSVYWKGEVNGNSIIIAFYGFVEK